MAELLKRESISIYPYSTLVCELINNLIVISSCFNFVIIRPIDLERIFHDDY